MKQPASLVQRATPWLVSGVSGLYVMGRSRQLSLANADDITLINFLLRHSDLVLVLAGNHVILHYLAQNTPGSRHYLAHKKIEAATIHQLRQVFSALTLGVGLVKRRVSRSSSGDALAAIEPVLTRMQRAIDEGTQNVYVLEAAIDDGSTP